METSKVASLAKRVEALAAGFIGVCFFSIGTSYFQERFIYRIPRILSPVFDLFGNVGAALGMLIIGIGFLVWGFFAWKSTAGKKSLYCLLAVVALAVGVFLANYQFKSPEKTRQEIEDSRQNQIDEIKKTDRPDLKSDQATKYFDDFEAICADFEANADSANLPQYYDKLALLTEQAADALEGLNNDQKYEFSKYNAKLSIRWGEKVTAIRENK